MTISSTFIKSVQDIMRQDAGVDGDAQRISQLTWLLFLKIFDDQETEHRHGQNDNTSCCRQAGQPENAILGHAVAFRGPFIGRAFRVCALPSLPNSCSGEHNSSEPPNLVLDSRSSENNRACPWLWRESV